ncbi:type VI secretion system-associated protein [Legionella quinlivanii]|uniref:Type VI secretion system-associated protein n=1 Tax=Legionella quinlivanii TaxID=45073 RepID=A0A364LGV9_9GAMM|nr:type VI secretion system baseplate subunit TssK [Legionella quinlivanii]RAP35455.1 type VI secretion system-associated protein [Legionella quinlivanii]
MVWKTAVDWEHGLFLQPQHFQCSELHQQFLLNQVMRYVTPYFWGFAELKLNHQALKNGRFEVDKMALFLPGGEYVEVDSNAVFLPRSFLKDWPANSDSMKVYVGVKDLSLSKKNVTPVNQLEDLTGVTTRYISYASGVETADFYHQESQAQLKTLQFVVKLFWEFELENTHNYTLIQIAELKRIDNEIKNNPVYIPSCVNIAAAENLFVGMRAMLENLMGVLSQLEKFKLPIDWYASHIDKANFGRLFSLRSLLRSVPVLKQYVKTGNVHPWHLFTLLETIACELSYFSTEVNLFSSSEQNTTILPDYNHQNLTACFAAVRTLLQKLIITIVADPGRIHRMTKEHNYYYADLGPYFIRPERRYYLVIYAENNQEEVASVVKDSSKLCAYSDIVTYIEYALPGVPITKLSAAPEGIPRGASCLYYKIDNQSSMWLKIERELKVALYMGKAPIDVVIDIVAVGA